MIFDILKLLQEAGGSLTRDEIDRRLPDVDEHITPEYIQFEKVTKNGTMDRPFAWPRNFAIKHLMLADFVTFRRAQPIVLTDKGINFDLKNFNAERDVHQISEPKMQELSRRNQQKKLVRGEEAEPDSEREVESLSKSQVVDNFSKKLLENIKKMPPKKFELLCRQLLDKMGVELDREKGVRYVADGGIDGYGYYTGDDFRTSRIAIQAKRWGGAVSSPEIDKFIGAVSKFDAEYGIFITTSHFTSEAKKAARMGKHVITLVEGNDFIDLICKYRVGVKPFTAYEIEDNTFFDEDF